MSELLIAFFSDVFVRSVVTKPIWMVIVLDQSEVSSTRMLLGQQVARLLVASLSEKDRVGLVLATDGTRVPRPHAGPTSQHLDLYPATHETKLFLGEHIYGLRSSRITKTNHTRALLEAFRIIRHATESQLRGGPEADALGPPTGELASVDPVQISLALSTLICRNLPMFGLAIDDAFSV
ncbi:unnamed protein product [Mesocestoides corti]|uniref:Uncharacterized protein n=1 Tax=Mesocestoides corti TaxID=53468 RepID=A0A0R3UCV1_MESCO|nr:unnamed protein product [Mesocestoides corti]